MVKQYVARREKRGNGLKFTVETYRQVSSFSPGTRIKYGPNPKNKNSKSWSRYELYRHATTVGEALKCGTKLADLLWELQRGNYKVLGDPKPGFEKKLTGQAKLDFDKAKNMLASFNGPRGLSRDIHDAGAAEALAKEEAWRAKKLAKCEAAARKLGLEPETLEDIEAMGINECCDIRLQRRVADTMAAKILQERRKIKPEEVGEVLSYWGFQQNENRVNVLPEGQNWVYSDTLGALRRRTGEYGITPPTKHYPNVAALFCQWLKDEDSELGRKFVCTSINLNANYAAKRHRDQNNEGPSTIRAFGNFTGGKLVYWPGDKHSPPRPDVETLAQKDRVVLDIKSQSFLFDGCRAHEVEPFSGERFSMVFFTSKGYHKLPVKQQEYLKQKARFPWPSPASMAAMRKFSNMQQKKAFGKKFAD
eukprot:TRINITY_DN76456_c0_g1_i1.p1 TRINITY_DN76456_c0_g1~~TRINITY_DN76456_c0_g1_i1.p1  ORF type:complete len:446 (+),score=78.94 TRINITY_DN76456_c0_g1_i1:80-1339(+)